VGGEIQIDSDEKGSFFKSLTRVAREELRRWGQWGEEQNSFWCLLKEMREDP
jgi:hypothetical protein